MKKQPEIKLWQNPFDYGHTNAPASLYIDPNGKGHTHTASGTIPNIDNSFAVVHKDYVLGLP
ncbi:MAG: hypothetical protein LBB91_03475 [Clostridiales bacterium]|jgi:hypothetical protein|nr:hypothetical protein [Clostridiales bacterium]